LKARNGINKLQFPKASELDPMALSAGVAILQSINGGGRVEV
jgi:hypothetical protein